MKNYLIIIGFCTLVSCKAQTEDSTEVIEIIDTNETDISHFDSPYTEKAKASLKNKMIEHGIDSDFMNKLLSIDYSGFLGKEVGLLLNKIGTEKEYYYSGDPQGYLGSCYFIYDNGIQIKIIPKKLEYLKEFDMDQNWDISLFKKEKIKSISITKDNEDVWLFVNK